MRKLGLNLIGAS